LILEKKEAIIKEQKVVISNHQIGLEDNNNMVVAEEEINEIGRHW
jgi:hypothetical protein